MKENCFWNSMGAYLLINFQVLFSSFLLNYYREVKIHYRKAYIYQS